MFQRKLTCSAEQEWIRQLREKTETQPVSQLAWALLMLVKFLQIAHQNPYLLATAPLRPPTLLRTAIGKFRTRHNYMHDSHTTSSLG